MKVIYPEKQTAVSVTSAASNFPSDNLLDDKPSKLWKAVSGVNTATITVTLATSSEAIAIYNTNADSVTITAKDSGGTPVKTETFTLNGTRTYNRCWMEYTAQADTHSVTLALTAAAGTTVEAGIVRGGVIVDFKNPQYGFTESKLDYSIIRELNNGAMYTKKRNIVRTFSFQMDMIRSSEFYDLSDIYDYYGPNPFAMLLAEGIQDSQWTIFGRMANPFQGSHSYPSDSVVSISITEAV